jgi:hypothetical protein
MIRVAAGERVAVGSCARREPDVVGTIWLPVQPAERIQEESKHCGGTGTGGVRRSRWSRAIAFHDRPTRVPAAKLIELAKRVQIPGYEEARVLFEEAISERVVAPAIGPGYYLQREIQDVLRWAARKLEDPSARST